MTFEDIMRIILPVDNDYVPYVNGQGDPNDNKRPLRSDYDDPRGSRIHGGVDINYAKVINGSLTYIGPNEYPNNHPLVYAPVSGRVIAVNPSDGRVSILCDGYVHTILHMREIAVKRGQKIEEGSAIGKMDGASSGNYDKFPHHVHYEITTYYSPTVSRESKIDPEAFWNNYGTNGRFALTGSFKKSNVFYGTLNDETIKGEGEVSERDRGAAIDESDNDRLSGGGGSDIIYGGGGNDTLYGGNAYNTLKGGQNQYYIIQNGILKRTEAQGVQDDADWSTDYLIGGTGKDYLDGGKGDDHLYGGVATVTNGQPVYSESTDEDVSDDTLIGGRGNDTIYGGKGNDTLIGGEDDDVLFGGEGYDTYVYNIGDGHDTIYDSDKKGRIVTGNNRTIVELWGRPSHLHILYSTKSERAMVIVNVLGKCYPSLPRMSITVPPLFGSPDSVSTRCSFDLARMPNVKM